MAQQERASVLVGIEQSWGTGGEKTNIER